MDNPYKSSQSSFEMPRESLDEFREKLRGGGVKTKDFDSFALWIKIAGFLLFVMGLLSSLIAVSAGHLWGVLLPVPGLALFFVGWGLGKYKPWARMAAATVLLPLFLLASFGAIAATIYAGQIGVLSYTIPLEFGYLSWVLLSPSGQMRNRLMVDVMARQAEIKQRVQTHDCAVATESLDDFLGG